MCRIEKAELLQSTDSALAAVCGDDAAAEPSLMQADPCLSNGVAALDRILQRCPLGLVERAVQDSGE